MCAKLLLVEDDPSIAELIRYRCGQEGYEVHVLNDGKDVMQQAGIISPDVILLDRVWGHDAHVDERTVDVHIRRLRESMTVTGLPDYIQTVRSMGYCLNSSD